MNILIILQLALTLLVNVSTNQTATAEQKQQALGFATQAVQMATEYLAQSGSALVVGDMGSLESGQVIPESISQPSAQSSTRVEKAELVISESSAKGSLFGKLYSVEVQGDSIVVDAVVVAIKDAADREAFYPNSGVVVESKEKRVLARLEAKECSAVKPSYACPGKEIETADQRQTIEEMGYHSRKSFTLVAGESYFFEVPESARLVYVKGRSENSEIEQEF